MVNFLSSVRLTSRDGRSLGRRTKAQKKHQLTLETLEERYCPSLTTVNLDFDSPSTRSLDSVLTSFHRGGIVPTADGLETIKLTGYHEPATGIIDPDLRAAGSVGAVFATANNSNTNSTATIILHGALGAQISFLYGTRNQENTATKGGFTAYTYSQSRVDQYGFPGSATASPLAAFNRFAVGTGAPAGPVSIGGQAGAFNSFSFLADSAIRNPTIPTRYGASQIDNVTLTVEPAIDILRNSPIQVTPNGGSITATFSPMRTDPTTGRLAPVNLRDLAFALGGDHFN